MRALAVLLLALLLIPATSWAEDQQAPAPAPSKPPASHHGSLKGALIGLAAGASVPFILGACDGSNCASQTLGAMVVTGALGFGIGAWVSSASQQGPVAIPGNRRVAVSPLIARQAQGGAVAVRF